MNVADENVIRLDNASSHIGSLHRRLPVGMVYAAQRPIEGDVNHDGRGLLLAIVMCMACWGVLGFFLLN